MAVTADPRPLPDAIEIRDVPERHRFELLLDGAVAGIAVYRLRGTSIVFEHTEVDAAYEGRGLGSKLARFVLDDARARGLRVRIECPFLRTYIKRHPGYADLLARR